MKNICFLLFAGLFFIHAHAQITTKEPPVSFYTGYADVFRKPAELKIMPSIDMERVMLEDEENAQRGAPPRYGYRIKAGFDLDNSGTWTDLPDGGRVWRLDINCPGALSVSLLYDKFWLPEGAKFFVYSGDKKQSIGAVTSYNNKGSKEQMRGFATSLIYGEHTTLEYYEPKEVKEKAVISLLDVVHGYRYIGTESMGSYGNSGSCQVNVNCSEGSGWQNEKNAVAKIDMGGYICSGALVNTTANDGRPNF